MHHNAGFLTVPFDGLIVILAIFGLIGIVEDQRIAELPIPSRAGIRQFAPPRQLGTLENSQISESSGIVASRRWPGVFWTHNDSGDVPRIFALDMCGHHLATVSIHGAVAKDWEGIACFTRGNRHFLMIGDIGDNWGRRAERQLYVVPEPDLRDQIVETEQLIRFQFEGGPRNCESIGVDSVGNSVLLVSKNIGSLAQVYEFPLPKGTLAEPQIAKIIATISIGTTTALDISRDGRRAVVLTYRQAYEFYRDQNESWWQAFARSGKETAMPYRVQGESICYGPDDKSFFLTSERVPAPLWYVPAVREPGL